MTAKIETTSILYLKMGKYWFYCCCNISMDIILVEIGYHILPKDKRYQLFKNGIE
jgi:hypothetical protein